MKKSPRNFLRALIVLALWGAFPIPAAWAREPSPKTLARVFKSLVSLETLAGQVFGEKQAFLDEATGQVVVAARIRPVALTRAGAGMIITSDGVIAANHHTVSQAGRIRVRLQSGVEAEARHLHTVPGTDIAFLKIDLPYKLEPILFADSEAVKKGQVVFTVGNSEELKGDLIRGKITGLGVPDNKKEGEPSITQLQTNFELHYGDSGAPVLDSRGGVLGMIVARPAITDRISLALPAAMIVKGYKAYQKSLKD